MQFDSGDITRINVSSPWMPSICSHCKGVRHSLKRCRTPPITCKSCNSTSHTVETFPRVSGNGVRKPIGKGAATGKGPATGRGFDAGKKQDHVNKNQVSVQVKAPFVKPAPNPPINSVVPLSRGSVLSVGDSSKAKGKKILVDDSARVLSRVSEAEPDSSDTLSSEKGEDFEEDFVSEEEHEYLEVVSKRNQRNFKGIGPKLN